MGMRKYIIFFVFALANVFMIYSETFAGGYEKLASKSVVGTPPEAMAKVTTIARTRGNGKPFYPVIDFFSRISANILYGHTPSADRTPGPGYGVPKGHVIGNAPTPHIIGKVMDRTGRGKVDFLERIKRHHAK
jgi:hypothetical protein